MAMGMIPGQFRAFLSHLLASIESRLQQKSYCKGYPHNQKKKKKKKEVIGQVHPSLNQTTELATERENFVVLWHCRDRISTTSATSSSSSSSSEEEEEEEEEQDKEEMVLLELLDRLGRGTFASVHRAKVHRPVIDKDYTNVLDSATIKPAILDCRTAGTMTPSKFDGTSTLVHDYVAADPEELVAVKILAASSDTEKFAATHEAMVMKRLSANGCNMSCHVSNGSNKWGGKCSYIVELRRHLTNGSDKVYLEMELCRGGSLRQVMKHRRLYEREVATVFIRLVKALMLCHSKGVVHRDVKPENLLLLRPWDISSVKLADFGLARMFKQEELSTNSSILCLHARVGTPGYMAPELKNGSTCSPWETDIWSAGVVLFEMLTGSLPPAPPPDSSTIEALFDLENECIWPSSRVSFQARHLLQQMLCVNPQNRPTLADILNHPWVARFTTTQNLNI